MKVYEFSTWSFLPHQLNLPSRARKLGLLQLVNIHHFVEARWRTMIEALHVRVTERSFHDDGAWFRCLQCTKPLQCRIYWRWTRSRCNPLKISVIGKSRTCDGKQHSIDLVNVWLSRNVARFVREVRHNPFHRPRVTCFYKSTTNEIQR